MTVSSIAFRTVTTILVCLSTLLISLSASAEELWVIGSFSKQANAEKERNRVSADTGLEVGVNESGGYYRVVIPKSAASKSEVEGFGFMPWSHAGDLMDLSTSTSATMVNNQYRVLASLIDSAGAELLLEKLTELGARDVAVIPVEVQGVVYHRLVQGPFTSRSDATQSFPELGLPEPWWWEVRETGTAVASTTTRPQRAQAPAMNEKVEEEETVETVEMKEEVAMVEPEPVITITPPGPNDSYVDYCLKWANKAERAIFCENGMFKRIGSEQLRDDEEASNNLLTCVYATRGSNSCN